MARLDRDAAPRGPVVQGFASGGFSVDGEVHRAVFLTPLETVVWAAPPAPAALTAADLEPALALDPPPEFLLLGTGPTLALPPRALRQALEARGIGLEAMDSRAAARTWGLLRGEERWIAAALLPLG
jgi:uncharacterized protein